MATKKAPVVKTEDLTEEQQTAAAEAATAGLPEAGHERREALKKREDDLQKQIEQMAGHMLSGTLNQEALEIDNEIAGKVQYLRVSNPRPERVYMWASKNRSMQHIQLLKMLGWQIVQGDDQEALELQGMEPGSHRSLGDVILMWIPRDRYIVLAARMRARTVERQRASAAGLIEMGDQFRSKGFIVRPHGMDGIEGPPIAPRAMTRQQAVRAVDKMLRQGQGTYVGK